MEDFHGTIAEGKEVVAFDFFVAQEAVEDNALGEFVGIRAAAVNVLTEIVSQVEQGGFLLDAVFDGAAEDDELDALCVELVEELARAEDDKIILRGAASQNEVGALCDDLVEAGLIVVQEGFGRRRLGTASVDEFGEAVGLEDGRLAVERENFTEQKIMDGSFGFAWNSGVKRAEKLIHEFRPTVAQPGERAIEIEDHMADLRAGRKAGGEFNRASERWHRKHLLVSKENFA